MYQVLDERNTVTVVTLQEAGGSVWLYLNQHGTVQSRGCLMVNVILGSSQKCRVSAMLAAASSRCSSCYCRNVFNESGTNNWLSGNSPKRPFHTFHVLITSSFSLNYVIVLRTITESPPFKVLVPGLF